VNKEMGRLGKVEPAVKNPRNAAEEAAKEKCKEEAMVVKGTASRHAGYV